MVDLIQWVAIGIIFFMLYAINRSNKEFENAFNEFTKYQDNLNKSQSKVIFAMKDSVIELLNKQEENNNDDNIFGKQF